MRHVRPVTPVALLLVASMLVLAPSAWGRGKNATGAADVFFVNAATGNDTNSCLSTTFACRTIGAAISKSGGQGTINVAAGTYVEHLTLGAVNLAIVGAGSGTTAIDGGGTGQVIDWNTLAPEGSKLSLSNITIQNGSLSSGSGAGLYANGSVTLTLSCVVFSSNTCVPPPGNQSTCFGGGLYFFGVVMTATNVSFIGNSANYGTGLFFATRNPSFQSVLRNVTFSGNFGGGALYLLNDDGAVASDASSVPMGLANVTFSGNHCCDVLLCHGAFLVLR